MVINIPTTYDKVFAQYLTIINSLLSSEKKLAKIEIEVLDKMLYIDNMYKHLPKDKRDIILFHKSTKDKIRESLLNMSKASFNNILHKLRTKGFIDLKSIKINVPIVNGKINFEFNISITDDSKEN